MPIQLKSTYTSILFSALITFALMAGQPYSSNASEQLDHRDEMLDNVYTPLWMGDPSPRPQDEVKTESNRYTREQLDLRDEMVNNVYTPLWMDTQDPSF